MSGKLIALERTESTNAVAKAMAQEGAVHGTAVTALVQTAGRGRLGREFSSPAGGIYLSLIFRPQAPAAQYLHLTPALAVAACDAVEACAGVRPQCKWVNDLVLNGKKLAGILTEYSGDAFIVGIGVNCHTAQTELPPMAVSLRAAGYDCQREELLAALVEKLTAAFDTALTDKTRWLTRYRQDCITLGREVRISGRETFTGTAVDVEADGALLVQTADGIRRVQSGEATVRGMYDYV